MRRLSSALTRVGKRRNEEPYRGLGVPRNARGILRIPAKLVESTAERPASAARIQTKPTFAESRRLVLTLFGQQQSALRRRAAPEPPVVEQNPATDAKNARDRNPECCHRWSTGLRFSDFIFAARLVNRSPFFPLRRSDVPCRTKVTAGAIPTDSNLTERYEDVVSGQPVAGERASPISRVFSELIRIERFSRHGAKTLFL